LIPTLIYCADGNKRYAEIAIRYGFQYGAQLPKTVYFRPVFTDQNWRKPDRAKYMTALAEYRPRLATVLDLEREDQLPDVLAWATEAAQYVSEAVIIIPKVFSIIQQLPREIAGKQVRLGYSVPTKFAGTEVPVWEFGGWPVHLLGGSPHVQMSLVQYMDVRSADGNYATKMANQHCAYYAHGTARYAKNRYWPKLNENKLEWVDKDVPYFAFALSCINIRAGWGGATAAIRNAVESDIPAIKKIANQHKSELGFVMLPSLREGIARRELHVAEYGRQLVGFVRWHRRRDDTSTVYEIAVDKSRRGENIGRALLFAVPGPIKLKCTVDNPANAFYEHEGFKLAGIEEGRKRALNVWTAA
jgi:GNAT superfamily N-acetyltransferase